MKVFISWSLTRSKNVAIALRWWLPKVIQVVKPFISNQDIRKGARGNVVIAKQLEEAAVGIICLTPENLDKQWILFEAGALSKLIDAYVCTLLIGELEPSDIEPPLGQFQHTKLNKEEIRALVNTINAECPADRALDPEELKETFDTWWPKLEERIKEIPPKPPEEKAPKKRTDDSKLDELLELVRGIKRPKVVTLPPQMTDAVSKGASGVRKRFGQRDVSAPEIANTGVITLGNGEAPSMREIEAMVELGLAEWLNESGGEVLKLTQMGKNMYAVLT